MGAGSIFQVFLPLDHASYVSDSVVSPRDIPKGTERIMFVDDEKALVELGKAVLERLGYRVTGLVSSLEAWERFRARPGDFDLIVTDYAMPQMTGIELARGMMGLRADIPIIICTGYSQELGADTALEMGIRRYLFKPLNLADTARAIREVLDEPKPV